MVNPADPKTNIQGQHSGLEGQQSQCHSRMRQKEISTANSHHWSNIQVYYFTQIVPSVYSPAQVMDNPLGDF